MPDQNQIPNSPPENQPEPLPENQPLPTGEAWQPPTMEKPFEEPPQPVFSSETPQVTSSLNTFSLENQPKFGGLKKIFTTLLVLLILGLAFFAVFKYVLPKFQKPKEVTLSYWGLWEPANVMQGIISDWQKDHPNIKIEYIQQSPNEYRERLQSALARNQGPDIFRFHITWVPSLKNELEPVPAEVMSAAEFEKNFYPVAKENLRSGSSFLGLPLEIDTLALFYNKQIFQAAGKTPPSSWDQLRQLALDLTTRDDSGRIQTAGVSLGATANIEHWSDILGLMMLQNGVDLTKPTGQSAEDALTYFTIFNGTDRVWDETLPNSTVAFATGKVAMYFGYSWDIFEIKNLNPNLDFGVVPVPQLTGTNLAWASFWTEGVAQKSQKKKEAWEFLKFLSSPQTMQKLYQAESQVRLFGEPYARIDLASSIAGNEMVAPFINQAASAKTWYLSSRTFDNGLNDRMIKYFEDAVNAVNGGKSAKEALATTGDGVAQLLSQYGLGSYSVR